MLPLLKTGLLTGNLGNTPGATREGDCNISFSNETKQTS